MNATLKETVVQLPLEDRLELLDAILDSVADTDGQLAPLNPTQRDLVRSRIERMQQHAPQPGTSWRAFMAKLEAS
jgi:putative addiction module component (TIGR02574 family)